MTEGLAKTRSSLLKEVLQDLSALAVLRSRDVADDTKTRTAWRFGYQQALEDVYERMEVRKL